MTYTELSDRRGSPGPPWRRTAGRFLSAAPRPRNPKENTVTHDPDAFAEMLREHERETAELHELDRADFQRALDDHPELELALREMSQRRCPVAEREALIGAIVATYPPDASRADRHAHVIASEILIDMVETGRLQCAYGDHGQIVMREADWPAPPGSTR